MSKSSAEQWLASRGLADLSLYWPTGKPIPKVDYESEKTQPTLTQLMDQFANDSTTLALNQYKMRWLEILRIMLESADAEIAKARGESVKTGEQPEEEGMTTGEKP